jgi:hypothetical protein
MRSEADSSGTTARVMPGSLPPQEQLEKKPAFQFWKRVFAAAGIYPEAAA